MPTGNKVTKPGLTRRLLNEIITYANGLIQSGIHEWNNPIFNDYPRVRASTQSNSNTRDMNPPGDQQYFLTTGVFQHYVLAKNVSSDRMAIDIGSPEPSVSATIVDQVPITGSEITAAAIVDIMMLYGHRMTRVRRTRFMMRGGGQIGSTRRVMFTDKTQYRMSATAFRNAVRANPNPFDALQPGVIATEAALDTLRSRIRLVISNHANSGSLITVTCCHSNCHSNCHTNRTRR